MSKVTRINLKESIKEDQRGWVINPLECAHIQNLTGNIHTASITPSSMRGNHYHPNSTEWLFIFGGPALFCWRNLEDNIIHQEKIGEEEPTLFVVPPNIVHVIKNCAKKDIYIMAVTSSPHPDQVRMGEPLC
ncbi:MAG: cupin domain-containing protein [bacterium]